MLIKDRVRELAAEVKPEMVSFAQKLIRTPSLSGQEKNVADLLLEEMTKLGYDEVFRDKWGNVVGIVHGTEEGPSIMYNGHMDHVDVGDASEWNGYDPYSGDIDEFMILAEDRKNQEKTEVIHGRAAADVKSGIACQVYSGYILLKLRKEGYAVKGNYIFSGVVLEEPAEQIGMKGLLEDTFVQKNIKVNGVISCEATGLQLYLGHRGRVELLVEVQGLTSHGSAPWLGINAINKAMKLIDKVDEKYKTNYYEDENLGRSSIALTNITCSPGSMCIVPDRCYLTFDRRFVPGETAESCIKDMEDIIKDIAKEDKDFKAKVSVAAVERSTYTGIKAALPNIKEAWKITEDHPFIKAASKGLEEYGEPVSYGYWDFGTDLAVISGKYHIASAGYSPMQELYCHRPVDMARIDFMQRALMGNIAIFNELAQLKDEDFILS